MSARSKDVYRGKHKRRSIAGGIALLVVLLITAAVVMFYGFQKYIVYGQDGISLELPILATPAPTDEAGASTGFAQVDAELVVEAPDYSAVEAVAGEELSDLGALFVPAERINEEALAKYVSLLPAYGANALVLEVKPVSGQLVWPSAADTAVAYALSGSYDLASAAAALKEQGIYLVAQLSCCVDSLLATRCSSIALKNAFGATYTDASGVWLDPYSTTVRQYITDLSLELYAMGFDEILLKYAEMPLTEEALAYSVQLSFVPTPTVGVSGFALKVTQDVRAAGAVISALVSYDSLAAGKPEVSGQDMSLFFKIFDRCCCWSGTAWEYGMYRDALSQYVTLGQASRRYLPIMSFIPEGASSYIVLVPDSLM